MERVRVLTKQEIANGFGHWMTFAIHRSFPLYECPNRVELFIDEQGLLVRVLGDYWSEESVDYRYPLGAARQLQEALDDVPTTLGPPEESSIGLDGSSYVLTVQSPIGVAFEWWCSLPANWAFLQPLIHRICRLARIGHPEYL